MSRTVEQRFMYYVERTEGCWIWRGAHLPRGYGRFYLNGKVQYAHRVSLGIFKQRMPAPHEVAMHSCDNPACVNPNHLSIGTASDNMKDASRKGRIVRKQDWRGHRNPHAKLTREAATRLRQRLSSGEAASTLASEFGLSTNRVRQIRSELERDGGGWEVEAF